MVVFPRGDGVGNQFAHAISEREANDQSRQSEDLALSLRFDEDIATNFA